MGTSSTTWSSTFSFIITQNLRTQHSLCCQVGFYRRAVQVPSSKGNWSYDYGYTRWFYLLRAVLTNVQSSTVRHAVRSGRASAAFEDQHKQLDDSHFVEQRPSSYSV
ncbi:hypothetical protein ElyMa_000360200 [Elysia marginata]|uniref:Uncharacterized protein n=1 Tax=Elysia marginata TaxID=1093978 RepID=A0AAV4FEL8_9GAST|nr:hypothetical protein ElyMa_000360200 [Elysia marginata]